MKVIGVYNMKGGVGKTTTVVNVSYLAARDSFRTLVVDLDPQGASSYFYRIRPSSKFSAKKFIKGGLDLYAEIKATDYPNLDLLPAVLSLRKLPLLLDDQKRRKKHLQHLLSPLKQEYDLVFLDCPPAIGLESENVFAASHAVMVPLIPTSLSEITYRKIFEFLEAKGFKTERIMAFFNMADTRKKLHREITETLGREPGFLPVSIPNSSEVERMAVTRRPLTVYTRKSKAIEAYRLLWSEVRLRMSL
jgi:chromosome partitioning protein